MQPTLAPLGARCHAAVRSTCLASVLRPKVNGRDAHFTTGIKRNDWRLVSEKLLAPPARLYVGNVPHLLTRETV